MNQEHIKRPIPGKFLESKSRIMVTRVNREGNIGVSLLGTELLFGMKKKYGKQIVVMVLQH